MTTKIETEHTPDGFIVRRFYADRYDEFRWQPDAQIFRRSHSLNWVPMNRALVPAEVLRAIAEEADRQSAA